MNLNNSLKDKPIFSQHKKEHVIDEVTGCINKEYLIKYVDSLISTNTMFTLFFIDIDNFKKINDLNGHVLSDDLLKDLAILLDSIIKDDGLLFRYGDDEFVILLPNIIVYDAVWEFARKYNQAIREHDFPYLDLTNLRVTATSGIARYPIDGKNFNELLFVADKALYRGKTKGKNCFIIYNKSMHAKIDAKKGDSEMNVFGFIDYIYQMFGYLKPFEALKKSAHMIGNYYSTDNIYLVSSNNVRNLYSSTYPNIPDMESSFENLSKLLENDHYLAVYRSNTKKDDKNILTFMEQRNIHTFLVYKTNDSKHSYLYLESKREKVWSEDETQLFLTLVNIYSLMEKVNK